MGVPAKRKAGLLKRLRQYDEEISDQLVAHGFGDGFRFGMNLELLVNALHMESDGVNGDAELWGDGFEVMAFDQKL